MGGGAPVLIAPVRCWRNQGVSWWRAGAPIHQFPFINSFTLSAQMATVQFESLAIWRQSICLRSMNALPKRPVRA
jgi:hypothetical protein